MILTISQAAVLGYKEIYASWDGIGDQICFMFALQTRFKQTGRKAVIFTPLPWLYKYADFCDIIPNVHYGNLLKKAEEAYKHHLWVRFISPTCIHWTGENENVVTWPMRHIAAQYCANMGLSGPVDIQPHLLLTEEEKSFGRFYKNQIAVMTGGMMRYKAWDFEKMQEVVESLGGRYHFVQIGAPSDRRLRGVKVLTHKKLSLRQTASVLYNSRCFVGSIGGLMHLAKAVGCPSVITYSSAEPLNYDSYPENISVYAPGSCNDCAHNLHDPQHEPCPYNYSCIRDIKTDAVVKAIEAMMARQTRNVPPNIVSITPTPMMGLENFIADAKTKYHAPAHTRWIKQTIIEILGFIRLYIVQIPQLTRYFLWFLPLFSIQRSN